MYAKAIRNAEHSFLMLFSCSSSGHHYRLPDWIAFPRHCCWKYPRAVVFQGQQGTENSQQLLSAELGIC